jgi:hypothetical protein
METGAASEGASMGRLIRPKPFRLWSPRRPERGEPGRHFDP